MKKFSLTGKLGSLLLCNFLPFLIVSNLRLANSLETDSDFDDWSDLREFFSFKDTMYYLSNSVASVESAKKECESKGYKLLSIQDVLENDNLKEHLKKIEMEVQGVWTSGRKLERNATTEYIWSTTNQSFSFSDFERNSRIGMKRSARNRRDTVQLQTLRNVNVTKDCDCSKCGVGKPSCENAPKCNITLLPCTTTTSACDVECPQCNSTRPNCSSTCPPCHVEPPFCEAIQGPCEVSTGQCITEAAKCTITTPDCITTRPDCITTAGKCKPSTTPPPCSGTQKCRHNLSKEKSCTTTQPPCVSTQKPCKTTQAPCYEILTPPPCEIVSPEICETRYEPLGCRLKRSTDCVPVKTCKPPVSACPGNGTLVPTVVCPDPTTTCPPLVITCPPEQTTCKPAIDCTPIICQSPPIICQEPSTNCPPAVTTCPTPVITCEEPVTTCPEPQVICPEPEVRCSKPVVRCPGSEVSCPPVIISCSEAKPICGPPIVECPVPIVDCETPKPCIPPTFGTTVQQSCGSCDCSKDSTTPMPDPDAESLFRSGCVGLARRLNYQWEVRECKDRQHYICM